MANSSVCGYWIAIISFYCCFVPFHLGQYSVSMGAKSVKSCFKVMSISLKGVLQQNETSNVSAWEEALIINSVAQL